METNHATKSELVAKARAAGVARPERFTKLALGLILIQACHDAGCDADHLAHPCRRHSLPTEAELQAYNDQMEDDQMR